VSYDTSWKMQTPEEYSRSFSMVCVDCGDLFDTCDPGQTSCPDCSAEEREEFLEEINERIKKCSAEIVEELRKREE